MFAEKKVATMIADAVLYGFSWPFFPLTVPHTEEKNDLVSDNTFFIFLRKKHKEKKNIHICLCFKDLALKVPRVLNQWHWQRTEKIRLDKTKSKNVMAKWRKDTNDFGMVKARIMDSRNPHKNLYAMHKVLFEHRRLKNNFLRHLENF